MYFRSYWLCAIVVASLCVAIAQGYTYETPPSTDSAHPGSCWDAATKKAVEPMSDFTNAENCERWSCNTDFSFSVAGCGSITPPKDCTLTAKDPSKPYPECCPKIKCN